VTIRTEVGPKPINALIAEALGWRVWEDPRPGREGNWYMERDGAPGRIEAQFVPDYISVLRNDVKMATGNRSENG
jgi:hypothetical protein